MALSKVRKVAVAGEEGLVSGAVAWIRLQANFMVVILFRRFNLRSFLCFALRILTAHELLRHKRALIARASKSY